MLCTLNEALNEARHRKRAVGAFNIGNKDILDAIIEVGEEKRVPIIVAASIPEFEFLGDEFFEYVKKRLEKSSAMFCLHLDHASNLLQIKRAIKAGFNSVMIDGSSLRFVENVAMTRQVVNYAHSKGVCVEAELGTIGNIQGASCGENEENEIVYTDPQQAKVFCEQTKVDALAIAIGTSHGMYPVGKAPKLRIDILDEIVGEIDTNLVLHGGSGLDDEVIIHAIQHGISKINISSEVKSVYFNEMKTFFEERPKEVRTQIVQKQPMLSAKKMIEKKIDLFEKGL